MRTQSNFISKIDKIPDWSNWSNPWLDLRNTAHSLRATRTNITNHTWKCLCYQCQNKTLEDNHLTGSWSICSCKQSLSSRLSLESMSPLCLKKTYCFRCTGTSISSKKLSWFTKWYLWKGQNQHPLYLSSAEKTVFNAELGFSTWSWGLCRLVRPFSIFMFSIWLIYFTSIRRTIWGHCHHCFLTVHARQWIQPLFLCTGNWETEAAKMQCFCFLWSFIVMTMSLVLTHSRKGLWKIQQPMTTKNWQGRGPPVTNFL